MDRLLCFSVFVLAALGVCSGQGGITRELVGVLARQDDKLDQVIEKMDEALEKVEALEEKVSEISTSSSEEGPQIPEYCQSHAVYCNMPISYKKRRGWDEERCRNTCNQEANCKAFDHHPKDDDCHLMPRPCPADKLDTPGGPNARGPAVYYVKPLEVSDFMSRLQAKLSTASAAVAAEDPCKILGESFKSYVDEEK